jgi:hypothetical protein
MVESATFALVSVAIAALSAIISVFIAVGNLLQARRGTEQAELAERRLAVAGSGRSLIEFGRGRYERNELDDPLDPDWDDSDEWFENYSELRNFCVDNFQSDQNKWDDFSVYCGEQSKTPHRQAAAEIAARLQDLGILVYSGSLPVQYVLLDIADSIIEDWRLCRSWVHSYRYESEQEDHTAAQFTNEQDVHYHRRHAEWIALIASIWWLNTDHDKRNTGWTQKAAEDIITNLTHSEPNGSDITGAKLRIQKIQEVDKPLVDDFVVEDVNEIIDMAEGDDFV